MPRAVDHIRKHPVTASLALAGASVLIPAGAGSAATFITTGASFGYTQSFSDSDSSAGSGELRDTAADDHCAWLEVKWDKGGTPDPTSTHVVCRTGNSAPVSLNQNSTFHKLKSMTLKLCRIRNGNLSDCQEQRIDNPNN